MGERAKLLKQLKELEHIKLDGLRFRFIDARGLVVGHLATEISRMLQGKDKPTYNPKHNCGDVVIVVNAAHVHFTQDQWAIKLYRWHTGYPGGLKERVAAEQWDRDPTSILRKAVHGMLPENRLRPFRMDKLKIFPEADHPFDMLPLVPFVPPKRKFAMPGIGWPLPQGLNPMNPEKYDFRARATPWMQSQDAAGETGGRGGRGGGGSSGASAHAGVGGGAKDGKYGVLVGQQRRVRSQVVHGLRDLDKLLTPEELQALQRQELTQERRKDNRRGKGQQPSPSSSIDKSQEPRPSTP